MATFGTHGGVVTVAPHERRAKHLSESTARAGQCCDALPYMCSAHCMDTVCLHDTELTLQLNVL